jgi:hypothetical protein
MSATLGDILSDAQGLIGEVAGIGVQTYGEGTMLAHAIRAFNLLHSKYQWDEYLSWMQVTLDGTTGRISANNTFDYVKDFGDFLVVQPHGSSWEVPVLAKRENPFCFAGSRIARYGSVPASDTAFITKRLQFYPLTTTDTLDILCRVHPVKITDIMTEDTVIHLDRDLVVYGAAFQALAFDDTNANAQSVVQNMLEVRFTDLTGNRAMKPISISGGSGIPTQWSEAR